MSTQKNYRKQKASRLNGVAFRTQEEPDAYETQIREAKAGDHRKIGREMKLFMTDDLVEKQEVS